MTIQFKSPLPDRASLVEELVGQLGPSVKPAAAAVGTTFEERTHVHSKSLFAQRNDTSVILIAEEEDTAIKIFVSDIRETEFSHRDDYRVYREQRERFVRDIRTWIAKSRRFGDRIGVKVQKVDIAMSFGEREVMLGITRSFRVRLWRDIEKDGLTRLVGPVVSILVGPLLSLSAPISILIFTSSTLTVLVNSLAVALKADELQLEEIQNGS
ncbi:hypothetical protein [Arenimonas soli]|uniref:hypothetical protein n=1 Tax=Arenimonas soli TaxID=2269504 RepID=UPI001663B294|nr:hypothetical protein [Arenimonas soli]